MAQNDLGEVKARRIVLMPAVEDASPRQSMHARMVPALQAGSDHWSAFVASDLAPMFAEEPWIDVPPNPDAPPGSARAAVDSFG